jgi:hypothetical protein
LEACGFGDQVVEQSSIASALIETLRRRGKELEGSTARLHNVGAIEAAIAQFCGSARLRFDKCPDVAGTRQFLVDHVDKVFFANNKIPLQGKVPLTHEQGIVEASTRQFSATANARLQASTDFDAKR